jgi:hypothetical protein
MIDSEYEIPLAPNLEAEIREMLGLFDVPAFARRGVDVEYSLALLHKRLDSERTALLEMVQMRLRQWSAVATGPDDWADVLTAPVTSFYSLVGIRPEGWADQPAPPRRRRAAARDLVASIKRFSHRWRSFLNKANLETINRQIEHYNSYYLIEKECFLGSARLAARYFQPKPRVTRESLLRDHPHLPPLEFVR